MDRVTHKSLTYRAGIDEAEVNHRRELLRLDDDAARLLAATNELLETLAPVAVHGVFERLLEFTEFDLLIGDVETLQDLQSRHSDLLVSLTAERYDVEHVEARLRLGLRYKQLGAEAKDIITLLSLLREEVVQLLEPRLPEAIDPLGWRTALERALTFDTQLVIDAFFLGIANEFEVAKAREERRAAARESVREQRARELEERSRIDELTGLLRPWAAREQMREAIALGRKLGHTICAVYFDVDGFKRYNDTYGHLRGDEVLAELGRIVQARVGDDAACCRVGGDEFAIAFPGARLAEISDLAYGLIEDFERAFPELSLSIGLIERQCAGLESPEQLLDCADKYMYAAKRFPGSRVATEPVKAETGVPTPALVAPFSAAGKRRAATESRAVETFPVARAVGAG